MSDHERLEAAARAMWDVGRRRYMSVVDLGAWEDADPAQRRDLLEDAAAALAAADARTVDDAMDKWASEKLVPALVDVLRDEQQRIKGLA